MIVLQLTRRIGATILADMIDNPLSRYVGRDLDRQAARELAYSRAHEYLREQMRRAMTDEPLKLVPVPAWHDGSATALDVVSDDFAGVSGEMSLYELLRIVGRVARGDVTASVIDDARRWIDDMSTRYAEFHAGDLVRQQEES